MIASSPSRTGCVCGMSVAVVTVSPEFVWGGGVLLPHRSLDRELAEVGLGHLEDLIAPAREDAAAGPEGESLGLLRGDLGRNRELLTYGHDLDDRWPIVRERF